MDPIVEMTLRVACISSALVGGIFFAFSAFVMQALDRLAPSAAIAAMQAINVAVIRPLVMIPLFGTGLLAGFAAYAVLAQPAAGATTFTVSGAAFYVIGVVAVTILGNVPLNERLARVHAESTGAPAAWASYLARWSRWNHVRTVAALAAAAAFALASV